MLQWIAMPYSGGLPDPGIEPMSPVSSAREKDSLLGGHWQAQVCPDSLHKDIFMMPNQSVSLLNDLELCSIK